jgi:hypothetical protein
MFSDLTRRPGQPGTAQPFAKNGARRTPQREDAPSAPSLTSSDAPEKGGLPRLEYP